MTKQDREKVDVRTSPLGWFVLVLGVLVALYFVVQAFLDAKATVSG